MEKGLLLYFRFATAPGYKSVSYKTAGSILLYRSIFPFYAIKFFAITILMETTSIRPLCLGSLDAIYKRRIKIDFPGNCQ